MAWPPIKRSYQDARKDRIIEQKRKLAIVDEKVTSRRNDFIHKVTHGLVGKSHATTFAVEDMNIKGMLKNRKLSKAIMEVG